MRARSLSLCLSLSLARCSSDDSSWQAARCCSLMNDLAIELLQAGRPAEAAAGFRAAVAQLEAPSERAAAYFNLGIALKDQSRSHDSIVAYLQALRLKPAFPQAHFNLARAFQMRSDDPSPLGSLRGPPAAREADLLRAAHHFRRSLANSAAGGRAGDAHRSLEEVLYQLGDAPAARRAHREFLRARPSEALRPRRRVPCERMLEYLRADRWRTAVEGASAAQAELGGWGDEDEDDDGDEEATGRARPPRDRWSLPPSSLCTPLFAEETRLLSDLGGPEQSGAPSEPAMAALLRARHEMASRGYASLPPPLSEEARRYAAAYYRRRAAEREGGFYRDEPSPSDAEHDSILAKDRWALDNDALALFLAERLAPLVSAVSRTELKPGFVKTAWYAAGSKLPPHRDQVQNLVSVSLVLDSLEPHTGHASEPASPLSEWPPSRWPLRLVSAPDANIEANLTASVGEALIFRGRDFLHWRPCCLAPDSHALVLLLHYVEASFPEASCELALHHHEDVRQGGGPAAGHSVRTNCLPHATGQPRAAPEPAATQADPSCDARAHVWLGPLHELEMPRRDATVRAAQAAAGAAEPAAEAEGFMGGRYLLYSSCVAGSDPDYCMGQLNNQLSLLYHALAVARALQRTLVLPPFLWMPTQNATSQQWFPASHFLDLCSLRRYHPVLELHEFAALAKRHTDGWLSHYHYPPYVLPPGPEGRNAYTGAFFERHGLRFASPRLISPHDEARQASSGRGDTPYAAGEGLGYWRAAALLLDRHQAELRRGVRVEAGREGRPDGQSEAWRERGTTKAELTLVSKHAAGISQWAQIALSHPELRGEAGGAAGGRVDGPPRPVPDALTLDFAPSYNFRWDAFEFDAELRASMRAADFSPRLRALARRAARALFGRSPYLGAHLRRDGYEHYCAGSGLEFFGGRRYGVQVSTEMCFPSVAAAAAAINAAAARHGLTAPPGARSQGPRVYLATNSVSEAELAELHAQLPGGYARWSPDETLLAEQPEWVPTVELLICAGAAAFVGTLPSTFSASVLVQRDRLGRPRNTTSFFGMLPPW